MNLELSWSPLNAVSAALHRAEIPIVSEIRIKNTSTDRVPSTCYELIATPPVFAPISGVLSALRPGQEFVLRDLSCVWDLPRLLAQTESETIQLRLRISDEDEVLAEAVTSTQCVAPTHWFGLTQVPESLAAHVQPNARSLVPLLKATSNRLRSSTGDGALDGYQRRDPARVAAVVQALYIELLALGLSYINPPASFEQTGQKVRTHRDVLSNTMATCLDIAAIEAALLEQAGLAPFIVLADQHAFTGVWTRSFALQEAFTDDLLPLRKRLELKEALVFDSSAVTAGLPFAEAVRIAERGVFKCVDFYGMIDIGASRASGITPLSDGLDSADDTEPLTSQPHAPAQDTFNPALFRATEGRTDLIKREAIDRWKERLLDLSLRNRLLNVRLTSPKVVGLSVPSSADFEDLLAAERRFEMRSQSQLDQAVSSGVPDPKAARLSRLKEDLQEGVLYSTVSSAEHDKRTLELYRSSRSTFEETGAVTLYVALGMLRWFESEQSEMERWAPLVLVPVELVRESSRKMHLRIADDETRVNTTLLKKLEADFGLDVTWLYHPPEDDSGLDIPKVFDGFRRLVLNLKRWEVVEQCWLAEFSFAKFLMWLDLEAKSEALLKNPIVDHIINHAKDPYPFATPIVPLSQLDTLPTPRVLTPMDADPSQLQAILAAADGNSFVLQGPPGTGKSQTITNMIVHLIGAEKTVLFVSEKIVALEVVQRRLEQVGFAHYCLELHSHQANKKAVLKQLKESFDRYKFDNSQFDQQVYALDADKEALNEWASALRSSTPFEAWLPTNTLQQAVALLLPSVDWEPVTLTYTPKLIEHDPLVQRWIEARVQLDPELHQLWAGTTLKTWSPALSEQLEGCLRRWAQADAVFQTSQEAARTLLGGAAIKLSMLLPMMKALEAPPFCQSAVIDPAGFEQRMQRIGRWMDGVRGVAAAREKVGLIFLPSVIDEDIIADRRLFERWMDAWALLSFFMLFFARRRMAHHLVGGVSSDQLIYEGLAEVSLLSESMESVASIRADAEALLFPVWSGETTDLRELERALGWASEVRERVQVLRADGEEEAANALLRLAGDDSNRVKTGGAARPIVKGFLAAYSDFLIMDRALREQLQLSKSVPQATVRSRIEGWLKTVHRVRDWCDVSFAEGRLREAQLGALVEAIDAGMLQINEAKACFRRSVVGAWWTEQLNERPALAAFRGERHLERIRSFQRHDLGSFHATGVHLRARLQSKIPPIDGPGEELGTLRNQLHRKRGHMPIRKLFARMPELIRRTKPCMLMSPLSIAQYLDPELALFDVVIFDEASQIPPWDAIGAIARGSQVVIVGDSKQLPPTSFFSRGGGDDDDGFSDDNDLMEMESILTLAIGSGLPELPLKWHYRSRHESLIAFSNYHYYDNRLHTFPSADALAPHKGVELRRVEGFYDRGKSKTNRAEALALVEQLFELLSAPDERRPSVGVVTFSGPQQRLIEELIEARLRDQPDLEPLFTRGVGREHVFIKNLENVQGDERDVMLFSICYGPDAAGKVTMNFGPLNREGGERRLNVAITRARERLLIFATLRPEDIDLRRTRAVGAAHLQAFLRYAASGHSALYAQPEVPEANVFDSPFEREVCELITSFGYAVHAQVGASGFRLDLAIVHPDHPGAYFLAVECDGASYHSSANARERDRLRQQVLEGLGWRFYRVWSTDWWYQREQEERRLREAIEAALAAYEAEPEERDEPQPLPERVAIVEDETPSQRCPDGVGSWDPIALDTSVAQGSFDHPSSAEAQRALMERWVEQCGPIQGKALFRQVCQTWGVRCTQRAVAHLKRVALTGDRALTVDRGFYWPKSKTREEWRGFFLPSADGAHRPIAEICEVEIANAAASVLARVFSISRQDLKRETARLLGFRRMSVRTTEGIERGLVLLSERESLRDEEGLLSRDEASKG